MLFVESWQQQVLFRKAALSVCFTTDGSVAVLCSIGYPMRSTRSPRELNESAHWKVSLSGVHFSVSGFRLLKVLSLLAFLFHEGKALKAMRTLH